MRHHDFVSSFPPQCSFRFCSFTVYRHLWVVMPFMCVGSLQSIISSSFLGRLPKPCIVVVLKETLNAISYLHNQGHLHSDIKVGNILIDPDGSAKLTDFGVSTSVYKANSTEELSTRLTNIVGTPYWMAPEVTHSHKETKRISSRLGSWCWNWSFEFVTLLKEEA
ncbi:hypothetical protein ACFX2I_012603 [Malus domestica]